MSHVLLSIITVVSLAFITNGDKILGGYTESNTKSPRVKDAANYAITKIGDKENIKDSDSVRKSKLVKIIRAREKVVNGVIYFIEFIMTIEDCATEQDVNCKLMKTQKCTAQVWVEKVLIEHWIDQYTLDTYKCAPLKPTSFNSLNFARRQRRGRRRYLKMKRRHFRRRPKNRLLAKSTQCPVNEQFYLCGACDGTCAEPDVVCTKICRLPGNCGCIDGYVRNAERRNACVNKMSSACVAQRLKNG